MLAKSSQYIQPIPLLACYPYTPANRSDAPALARTHFMYVASVDSLHPSSINQTDAHTSSFLSLRQLIKDLLGLGDCVLPDLDLASTPQQ